MDRRVTIQLENQSKADIRNHKSIRRILKLMG